MLMLLLAMKGLEIFYGRKLFLERQFENFDVWLSKVLSEVRYWWGHINIKNAKLIFYWIAGSIKKSIIDMKRRFDHKQSHFFAKREHDNLKNKGSVSFFLKNVSDYKKSLGEGNSSQKSDN